MSGIARGFDRAMRIVGDLFYYSFCIAAFAALGTLLFSGVFTLHGMAKSTTVVRDVLDRFEPSMVFSSCPSNDTTTKAQCAVKNGYVFYGDDYGYRISLVSDPDRTPVITLATQDSLKRLTSVRSETDLQKFSEAFSRSAHDTISI